MPDEVAYLASASGAKAFLCHGDFPDHAKAAANPALEFIWRIGEGNFGETSVTDAIAAHAGAKVENTAVDYDDSCWFFFTSGTTGRSKGGGADPRPDGVRHHQPSRRPDAGHNGSGRLAGGGAACRMAPASINWCRTARGVPTILLPSEKFDIAEAFRLIEVHRVSNIFTCRRSEDDGRTPRGRQIRSLLAALHHLCRRADVPRGPEGRAEQARLGAGAIFRASARSPATSPCCRPTCTIPRTARRRVIGTCGFERTGMQVSIQGDDGSELKPFETGEICVIGPGVFAGYYNNPRPTRKHPRRLVRTGDLGHMDDEGPLHHRRASDTDISGGSNIYPREARGKILTHPRSAKSRCSACPTRSVGERRRRRLRRARGPRGCC